MASRIITPARPKVRIEGTKQEIQQLTGLLDAVGVYLDHGDTAALDAFNLFEILSESGPYPNRGKNVFMRSYLEVHLRER